MPPVSKKNRKSSPAGAGEVARADSETVQVPAEDREGVPLPPPRRKAAKENGQVKSDGRALVIVESPTKQKTIAKFLGKGYTIVATLGHIRDLPSRALGVDEANS